MQELGGDLVIANPVQGQDDGQRSEDEGQAGQADGLARFLTTPLTQNIEQDQSNNFCLN